MKDSPDHLEKFVHQTLRSLPHRRAPHALESRVLAAIEARANRPWWKQSYAQWPVAARCIFLLLSGGLAKVALMAAVWIMGDFEVAAFANAFSTQFSWFDRIGSVFGGITGFIALLVRNAPSTWLYGGAACLALLYATLVGVGATAYRTLFAQR